jgi:hypothetical protein
MVNLKLFFIHKYIQDTQIVRLNVDPYGFVILRACLLLLNEFSEALWLNLTLYPYVKASICIHFCFVFLACWYWLHVFFIS